MIFRENIKNGSSMGPTHKVEISYMHIKKK